MGNKPSSSTISGEVSIDHFKLAQVIGKGAFGVVRIIQKRDTKVKYALKYINKEKCVKRQMVRNIFRERFILENCHHPFIINLNYAFQDDEHLFFILDLAAGMKFFLTRLGGDLRFHLERFGRFSLASVRIYAAEIASAIDYLHSKDILHRDLKPENLLLDDLGHLHITDFNVAILLTEKIPSSKSGTTAYMAPEMFLGRPYSFSVDWWALGVIIYECTYGVHPFKNDKKYQLEAAIQSLPINFYPTSAITLDNKQTRYPYVNSSARLDFLKGLLDRNIADRIGKNGFSRDIKRHSFFNTIDWEKLLEKQVIPEFIPDANQNNYGIGPALEELLYDSTPLNSKPVRKRKQKNQMPPRESFLWNDYAGNLLDEDILDYMQEYFQAYTKESVPFAGSNLSPGVDMKRSGSASSSKSTRSQRSLANKTLDASLNVAPPVPNLPTVSLPNTKVAAIQDSDDIVIPIRKQSKMLQLDEIYFPPSKSSDGAEVRGKKPELATLGQGLNMLGFES